MFQQTFVPDTPSGRKPIGIAVSLIAQSFLVALCAVTPLLVNPPVPTPELQLLFLGPKPAVSASKLKTVSTAAKATNLVHVRPLRLIAPTAIPRQINTSVQELPDAPDIANVAGLTPGKNSLFNGPFVSSDAVLPPLPKQQQEIKELSGPVTIGGNVAAANLTYRVDPEYPPLAKSARVQGEVIFQAVIGADGQIRNLQLQRGHPLLVVAARNAILQWRYRPTLLNGKPVEVATTITVRFSLSQ